ncbi:MAG: enoyl-CoA hydratase-related protein [Acidimicrobiia bacterium]|nr:enoyl-CoA hydratase-related protein [Acidimicrobiia bacterium]
MTDELRYEVSERVALVTFNRPDQMNTISGPMLGALSERLLEADADPEVRAIVITGAGRAWCAGLDVAASASGGGLGNLQDALAAPPPGEFDLRSAPPVVLHKIDTPTIAALNGGAAGYGLDLALGCDIRIAAPAAKLAFAYAARGILPESAGTWLLPRLVGSSKAAELLFTARTVGADEALTLGLVSEVVDAGQLTERALGLAGEIAANAPLAVRAIKRMLRMGATENLEDHVHRQFLALLPLVRTKDFAEGMRSFVERRPPDFQGR